MDLKTIKREVFEDLVFISSEPSKITQGLMNTVTQRKGQLIKGKESHKKRARVLIEKQKIERLFIGQADKALKSNKNTIARLKAIAKHKKN